MAQTDDLLADRLAAFEQEQDPTLLHQALERVEAAERDVPPGDTAARSKAVSLRLRFFAALDRHIDPRWNVGERPVMGAPPPATHQGIVRSSGEVDPESIPHPAERAAYERALQASREYARWYDVQFQLRRLDERAMLFAGRFLAERYTGSPADREELEELLAESPVNEQRRQRLRELLDQNKR
jgi:hypothetical protein